MPEVSTIAGDILTKLNDCALAAIGDNIRMKTESLRMFFILNFRVLNKQQVNLLLLNYKINKQSIRDKDFH
jgi:hypothetical protein